jgi:anti-anti-sigma factor
MQSLKITLEKNFEPGIHIAHMEGAFDGSVKEPLIELESLINNCPEKTRVVLDLKNLSYLNSYAIGQLVAWHNHLVKIEGQIILAAPSKNVEDIFNILGISALFKIFPDVQTAVESVR